VSELPSKEVDCSTNPAFGGMMWSLPSQLWITTNTTMNNSVSGWHSVQQIVTPPDAHVCGNDLAILILSDLVSSSEAKPIIPGVQYPMDDPQYVSHIDAVGYGSTSPQNTGTGTRRIKQNIPIRCIPNSDTSPCPTVDATGAPLNLNPNEFPAGDGTCEGDSGSSAFDHGSYLRGAPVSFGVLSRGGISADGNSCEGSLYTRLDAWRDLVVNTANSASSNWTLYPKPTPDWTVYVAPKPKDDGGSSSGSSGSSGKPTTKPSGKGIGETCANDGECASKTCRDQGDGTLVCTTACTDGDNSACPDGYQCRQSMCFVAPAGSDPNGATTTTTSGGCAVSREPSAPIPWALGAMLGFAAVARRRRNRA
jgi:MYXO-CTERM domain-containing protein